MENQDEIKIENLSFKDVKKAINLYSASSDYLKSTFRHPWPLTSKIGKMHLLLSTTPLKPFLVYQIDSVIAKKENELIGYAYILNLRYKKRDKKVLGIMVKEGFEGKGIGSLLLTKILKNQDEICLSVLDSNKRAISLYEKHGFKTESIDRVMKLKMIHRIDKK